MIIDCTLMWRLNVFGRYGACIIMCTLRHVTLS